jgi:hypothetical protein
MDPVLLIGRYSYSHWVLGARPGGIESYRSLPQLGVLPCDRGNAGSSPWLLRFVTGATRLLRILVSESAYLIWTLRCEHVIWEKTHSRLEIKKKWTQAINRRLTEDKIIATKVKRDIAHIRKGKNTWEAVLGKTEELPDGWIYLREVLVGTRERV